MGWAELYRISHRKTRQIGGYTHNSVGFIFGTGSTYRRRRHMRPKYGIVRENSARRGQGYHLKSLATSARQECLRAGRRQAHMARSNRMDFTPIRLRTGVLTVAIAAAAAGCSDNSESAPVAEPSTTVVESSTAPAPSAWYQPPAAFEGLDPCSLATPEEVSALAGQPGLVPSRNEGLQPDMAVVGKIDTCSWMRDRVDPVAVSLGIEDQPRAQGQDAESQWMSEQLGRPVLVTFGRKPAELGVRDCVAFVGYSDDRSVSVLLRLPADASTPAPTDTDNLCTQNRTTLRDIFSRVPWK
ncbi:DUF3558 family protein [Nocardia sp. NPDC050378]|uniref:DUF3558 family protein n=1 Tax=Nocardia sp. NPDC050378 TaxID=3155400 RepID=UPI0033E759CF